MNDIMELDLVALFDEEARALYRYFARRVGDWVAEDALSQTFLIAHESRDRYDPAKGPARAWLYGIASRVVHRHHRDEARRLRAYARTPINETQSAADDHVVDAVDAHAAFSKLAADLRAMTAADRDVLLLFAWADLSYDEIAAALDIPVGTVRSRLHRARRQMRAGHPALIPTTTLEPDHG